MATATCVVTYKNGRKDYIEIDFDAYDEVKCGHVSGGYFVIMARRGRNIYYLAEIRSNAMSGYYFKNAALY